MKSNLKKLSILTSILVLATIGITGVASTNNNNITTSNLSQSKEYAGNESSGGDAYPEVKNMAWTNSAVTATTLESDGEHLYVWGDTTQGLAGEELEVIEHSIVPNQVLFDDWSSDWKFEDVTINKGMIMTLVRDSSNTQHLFAWGNNDMTGWGYPDEHYSLIYGYEAGKIYSPVELDLSYFNNEEIKDIALSPESSIVVTEGETSDHIYTWGSNFNGATGNGIETGSTDLPTEITLPNMTNFEVTGLSAEYENYNTSSMPQVLLSTFDTDTNTSSVYMWGMEGKSSFGFDGDPDNSTDRKAYAPGIVKEGLDGVVTEVTQGDSHAAAIYQDNTDGSMSVWQWGFDRFSDFNGQLDSKGQTSKEPIQTYTTSGTVYDSLSNLTWGTTSTSVRASKSSSGAYSYVGWGRNYFDILQQGTGLDSIFNATLIDTSFTNGVVKKMYTVADVAFAIVDEEEGSGQLYSWGVDKQDSPDDSTFWYLKGVKSETEYVDGRVCPQPTKVQFNLIEPLETSDSFPWWIIFVTMSLIGILIFIWISIELILDNKEKDEHHWLHIGRHHE